MSADTVNLVYFKGIAQVNIYDLAQGKEVAYPVAIKFMPESALSETTFYFNSVENFLLTINTLLTAYYTYLGTGGATNGPSDVVGKEQAPV